jgi:hypothetical protein
MKVLEVIRSNSLARPSNGERVRVRGKQSSSHAYGELKRRTLWI